MDLPRRPVAFEIKELAVRWETDAGEGDVDGGGWAYNIPNGVRNLYRHICVRKTRPRLPRTHANKHEYQPVLNNSRSSGSFAAKIFFICAYLRNLRRKLLNYPHPRPHLLQHLQRPD